MAMGNLKNRTQLKIQNTNKIFKNETIFSKEIKTYFIKKKLMTAKFHNATMI